MVDLAAGMEINMQRLKLIVGATIGLLVSSISANATPFDGLFRPDYPFADSWSCNEEFIGMDGGAVAVRDNKLYGVESICQLSNPQPVEGKNAIRYLSTCSAEGSEYSEDVVISRTDNGISVTRGENVAYWKSCPANTSTRTAPDVNSGIPIQDRWVFRDREAIVVSRGLSFSLGCETLNPSSMYPTAALGGYCPMCGWGDTIKLRIYVDGQFIDRFEFAKQSNAVGFYSRLYNYPLWFDGVVGSLSTGNKLELFERNDLIASFPLTGSSQAINQLRQACN